MNCELCGRQMDHYHDVIIDGVRMKVCSDCSRYGKEVNTRGPARLATYHSDSVPPVRSTPSVPLRSSAPPRKRTSGIQDDFNEPVIDFGKVIKKRREEMGLSQEELAKRLQEKRNVVAKIEREEIKPDSHTARKIQKIMGIKILEEVK